MKKSCQYCGRIHASGYECPKKPVRKKQGVREAEQFRNSHAWQKKREQIKRRDHYLCRYCLAHGTIEYGNLEVHHIEPLEQRADLGLEDAYLITLCGVDHENAERGAISKAELMALAGTPPTL